MTTAFATTATVPTRPCAARLSVCTFVTRPSSTTITAVTRPRRSFVCMEGDSDRADGYKIQQSEFVDPVTDDDSGDGFMGEADMDDMLGVSMPDDLASFEIKEIQNSRNRDELVNKLKDIADRRKDIRYDRRKGMGMDNADNYLNNL